MTLGKVLEQSAKKNAAKPAIVFGAKTYSYGALNKWADQLARVLQSHGVHAHDRVAICLANSPEFIASYYGIQKAGAAVVPVNPNFKKAEIHHIVSDSQSKAVICFPSHLSLFKELKDELPTLEHVLVYGEAGKDAVALAKEIKKIKGEKSPAAKVSENDVAAILYTSGTTGRPKGAMLTHKNLISNVKSCIQLGAIKKDDIGLCVLPLFHTYAMTAAVNIPVYMGMKIVVMDKFIPGVVMQQIKKHKVTVFPAVPTMFAYILNMPSIRKKDLSSLRFCFSGAMALSNEILKQWEERMGVPILEGYGPTETAPVASCNPLKGKRKIGSVGLPIPGVEMSIVDEEGHEQPAGKVGEILIKGDNVMKGYLNNEDATKESIRYGWYHTGDLGYRDEEGYYYIVDRKKDMVIVGGFNVYPREVEETLIQHKGVLEAAVVGVFDRYKGEAIKAFIVPKQGITLDYDEVMDFLRDRLADYKVPRFLEFRDALPKTDTGKILKRELK